MDITPLIGADRQVVESYSNARFRVSGAIYTTSVIVFPDAVHVWESPAAIADLTEHDFSILIAKAEQLDVVLLGTGAKMALLSPTLRQALKQKGLSIDCMDTGAACRTYNVLMAEGRRVAAALLLVNQGEGR